MYGNSPALLALILLIIVVFIVAIALSYNPTPVLVKPENTQTAKDLLTARKEAARKRSSLSPNREELYSPASVDSEAWNALRELRGNHCRE